MSDEISEEVLDRWIAKQTPWDLQSAIYLLLKRNPEGDPPSINFDPENDSKTETRAYTYALQAIQDPSNPLRDLLPTKLPKLSAADYSVHKRDFILWATEKWGGGAPHLDDALKRYGNRDKKISKTQLKKIAREAANRAAFNRLVDQIGIKAVREFSYSELWRKMRKHFDDPSQELYSVPSLKTYRNNWQRESS
jgi:hypothetical protein